VKLYYTVGIGGLAEESWNPLATPVYLADDADQQIGNLLAVIHRDGGQHTNEVGFTQSFVDATEIVCRLRQERDEWKAKVDRLRIEKDAEIGALKRSLEASNREIERLWSEQNRRER